MPSQEIITKDNATVKVDGVAFYQVLDARRAAYEVADLKVALLNLVMTNVRTVMGSMDLDQLLSHRDEINARLLTVIDAASEPWGIKVTRVEIKDIEPPKDLVDAMARQMKAEREKRAVILEAEGMRQSDITRAEGRKAALVLEAEGRRDAAFRAAEAVERTAQAEAKATRAHQRGDRRGRRGRGQLPHRREIHRRAARAGAVAEPEARHRADGAVLARRHARGPEPDRGERHERRCDRPGLRRSSSACEAGGAVPDASSTAPPPPRRRRAVERLRRRARWTSLSIPRVWSRSPGSSSASRSAPSRRWRPAPSSSGSAPPRRSSAQSTISCRCASSTQLLLFGVLVSALVLIGRRVYGSFGAEPGPLPQSRAHAMIGADFFLDEPIVRGFGRIRVGDSSWRVAGEDCPAGARVRVAAVENGSLLRVERVEDAAVPPAPPQR